MSAYFKSPRGISKKQVVRAGEALAGGNFTEDQYKIAQQWRDSHAYVLNIFQSNLRRWTRKHKGVVLAQRLKRMSTIQDKLATGRAGDLATMHDLAGCRLIFPDLETLHSFRQDFHTSRSKHERVNGDKYDYISAPKETGYRGIHDVYKFHIEGDPGENWNGLRVEIQYRTKVQHAWATAVEIADALDGERVKFDVGANPKRERLFFLISEWLARRYENSGFHPIEQAALESELADLDDELNIFKRMRALKRARAGAHVPASRNLVLEFGDDEQLKIRGFRSYQIAMEYRNERELAAPNTDVVFIRADNPIATRSAFRNYFRNAEEFLKLINRRQ